MRNGNRLLVIAAFAVTGATGSVLTAGPAAATSAWTPPPGYVFENSYFGSSAWCDQIGQEGVVAGKWIAYVCHETLHGYEFPRLFSDLYVKR
ncbi:hypothetical protein HD597_012830 [Nonomuraea thailandensis]|uniref:Secreted protein n=1 Tax=Nonomuraea thailandensis TaxID=1188745 RepID=A0A9X2KD51_9ACTN|nr:hypothetical protein [Nonomuraea thailandensis]MCP2365726.1 hypothetical protein [Nonomuraea thailandensis]